MYRIFYQGKYQGESSHYPLGKLEGLHAYVYNGYHNNWLTPHGLYVRSVPAKEVPKEYLALNLLL